MARETVTIPRSQYEAYRAAVKAGQRLRLEFDFLIESGILPDVRADIIFKQFDESDAGIEIEDKT